MSGLIPPRHGVRDNGQLLGGGTELLATALAASGYSTAAFVSGFPFSRAFGLARGFQQFDDSLSGGEGQWLERPAPETTAAAASWLATAAEPPADLPDPKDRLEVRDLLTKGQTLLDAPEQPATRGRRWSARSRRRNRAWRRRP